MSNTTKPNASQLIVGELQQLLTFKPHPRPWHMPLVAALAISFPVFVGSYTEQLALGMLASLGSMVFLNLPYQGGLFYRLAHVLACSFGFVACFALGLIAHALPVLILPTVMFVAFWVVLFGRYFRLSPPAGLFIIMATAIALFMPTPLAQVPFYVGIIALGCLFSGMAASAYTLWLLTKQHDVGKPQVGYQPDMLTDSTLVAVVVTLSLAVALWLKMPRPYWVLVGCYVVVVGASLQSMWSKQFQRIVGTGVGMLVAWLLLWLQPDAWGVALAIFALAFSIETLVVRNYASAALFITPLTILLAEYGNPNNPLVNTSMAAHEAIIMARFWDTALGCVIGVIGGAVMYSTSVRPKLQSLERRLMSRLHIHL